MKREWSKGTWARWGWLATTLTLGVGLILLSWANDRSARQATQALHWGQSRLITEGTFRDIFHGPHGIASRKIWTGSWPPARRKGSATSGSSMIGGAFCAAPARRAPIPRRCR